MNVCPSCGLPNDENARFCKDCRARLENYTRARPATRPTKNIPQPTIQEPSRLSFATISLVLGIFGIGIPAVIVGIIAWRRDPQARGKALAGIILGAVGTVALTAALVLALPKGDPLHRQIRPDQVGWFASAADERILQLEEQARVKSARLGPGADTELGPVYGWLHTAKSQIETLGDIADEESLNIVRAELVAEIDSAGAYLKTH